MTYNSAKIALNKYLQIIKIKIVLGIILILIFAIFSQNLYTTLSALLGFLLALLPALFYIKIAWSNKILLANQIFAKHKKAEIYKFNVNLLGFLVVFISFKQVHALALFTTYMVTLSGYWLSLFFRIKH